MMDYIIAEYPEDGVFDNDTRLVHLQTVRNSPLPHKGDMVRFCRWRPETRITTYWCEVVTILHDVPLTSDKTETPFVLVKILNKQNIISE